MGKPFNIAETFGEVLKSVPKLGTGGESIEYIDIDRLHDDPGNFYSMDGLEELAANIELIGLQQPVRVRPDPEREEEYILVSGHRRCAAIRMAISDDGREDLRMVPCIVEAAAVSPAMQELRLIYANAATREMSNYDKARQAERVEALLYELQEQGVEFPGRMRDHVAEACRISKSKLARLKVIRERLTGELARQFEAGTLNESAAYNLARLPEEPLRAIEEAAAARAAKNKPAEISGTVAQKLADNIEKYQAKDRTCSAHAGGPLCHHAEQQIVWSSLRRYDWQMCDAGACCLSCYRGSECSGACEEAKAKAKREKAKRKSDEDRAEDARKAKRDQYKLEVLAQCRRLLPYVQTLDNETKLFDYYSAATAGQVKRWAKEGASGETFWGTDCVMPFRCPNAVEMAKTLGVSVDFVLGLTEEPYPTAAAPAAAGGWIDAKTLPDHPCECVVEFDLGEDHLKKQHKHLILCRWDGDWYWRGDSHPVGMPALRWCEVPCAGVPRVVPVPAAGAWISVEDALPETDVDVLTLDSDGSVDVDHIDERSGEFFYGNGPTYRVTHWAAIPKKPEEE